MTDTGHKTTDADALDSGSWVVSLAFWLVLFAAAGVYAAVALAPKFLAHAELEQHYVENQIRLVELERRNDHLARVADALAEDPDFATQLLRVDFDAVRPGEERIPVDPRFHLAVQGEAAPVVAPTLPWYTPLVEILARDAGLRRRLLIGVAIAVVLAFAVLHDANGSVLGRATSLITAPLQTGLRLVRGRYGASDG